MRNMRMIHSFYLLFYTMKITGALLKQPNTSRIYTHHARTQVRHFLVIVIAVVCIYTNLCNLCYYTRILTSRHEM